MSSLVLSASATARFAVNDFIAGDFIEIGVLIRSQQNFFPTSHIHMASLGRSVHLILYESLFHGFVEAALLFHFEEKFPSLLGDRNRQSLHIIRTGSRVGNTIQMRLFFQQ